MSDVTIVITRETAALTQAGFGLPLLLAVGSAEDYALCADLAAVEDAGFNTTDGVYRMAERVFGQSPRPQKVAVVGIVQAATNATAIIEAAGGAKIKIEATGITGDAGNNEDVEVVNDTDTGGTLDISHANNKLTIELDGAAQSADDIVTEINANISEFTAYRLASGDFETTDIQKEDFEGGADASISGGLNELIKEHNDWYFLLSDEQDEDEVKEISDWAQANKKIYVACPDEDMATNISISNDLKNNRTAVMYHEDPDTYPDAAWVGRCAPEAPGSITWKFKTLNGITPLALTSTEKADLESANVNTYVEKYGVSQTSEGLTTSGEYIDVIRGIDFIDARLAEGVSRLLFTSPKVPFTNAGISQVEAEVVAVMQLGVENGIIAVDDDGNGIYDVSVPDVDDVPDNDKANRNLPDVGFVFTLAGAIHTVKPITGVVRI